MQEESTLINADKDIKKNVFDINNDFIEQSLKIQPFLRLFKVFALQDEELVMLCMAAIRAIASETKGFFSREEALEILQFMELNTAKKVFKKLEQYEWITNNGIRYELPNKVRYLSMFMLSTLSESEENYSKMIAIPTVMSELDDVMESDRGIDISNINIIIGALNKVKEELQSVLEQKSSEAAKVSLVKSRDVRNQIERVQKLIKKKNLRQYNFNITTQMHEVCADIINLHQDLLNFVHEDIQANARSFGEYLTPEQVNEAIHKLSVDRMAFMMMKHFISSHENIFITKDELETRGLEYLERKVEYKELVPPPEPVEIKKREVVISDINVEINEFCQELLQKVATSGGVALKELLIQETYGGSLYRGGLLVAIKQEAQGYLDNNQIVIETDGTIESLERGPVEKITKGQVKLVK